MNYGQEQYIREPQMQQQRGGDQEARILQFIQAVQTNPDAFSQEEIDQAKQVAAQMGMPLQFESSAGRAFQIGLMELIDSGLLGLLPDSMTPKKLTDADQMAGSIGGMLGTVIPGIGAYSLLGNAIKAGKLGLGALELGGMGHGALAGGLGGLATDMFENGPNFSNALIGAIAGGALAGKVLGKAGKFTKGEKTGGWDPKKLSDKIGAYNPMKGDKSALKRINSIDSELDDALIDDFLAKNPNAGASEINDFIAKTGHNLRKGDKTLFGYGGADDKAFSNQTEFAVVRKILTKQAGTGKNVGSGQVSDVLKQMHALGDSHWYKVMNKSTGGATSTAMKSPKDVKKEAVSKQAGKSDTEKALAKEADQLTDEEKLVAAFDKQGIPKFAEHMADAGKNKNITEAVNKASALSDEASIFESIKNALSGEAGLADDVIAHIKMLVSNGKSLKDALRSAVTNVNIT